MYLTQRYMSSSYMVDLDLLSRSPEVIDLLLVILWFLGDISANN
jgi:hypothetical protein